MILLCFVVFIETSPKIIWTFMFVSLINREFCTTYEQWKNLRYYQRYIKNSKIIMIIWFNTGWEIIIINIIEQEIPLTCVLKYDWWTFCKTVVGWKISYLFRAKSHNTVLCKAETISTTATKYLTSNPEAKFKLLLIHSKNSSLKI